MNVVLVAIYVMSISHKYVGLRDVGTTSSVCLITVNSSVCIGSFASEGKWPFPVSRKARQNKIILFCLAFQETGKGHFPSMARSPPYTSVNLFCFLRLMLTFIPLFVDLKFVLIWHSSTTWFKYRFTRLHQFTILCVALMPLRFRSGRISSVDSIWS